MAIITIYARDVDGETHYGFWDEFDDEFKPSLNPAYKLNVKGEHWFKFGKIVFYGSDAIRDLTSSEAAYLYQQGVHNYHGVGIGKAEEEDEE